MSDTPDNDLIMQRYFDWIPMISLAGRCGCRDAFQVRLTDWPFRTPDRFGGVQLDPPDWFRAGPGAWGCAQSHINVLEQAMRNNYEYVLVLEDDAVLCDDFKQRAVAYVNALPDDWDQVYFGGEHSALAGPPTAVNTDVLRVSGVERTYAYAVSRKFFKPLYDWITDYDAWQKHAGEHIDHRMCRLHATGRYNVYAPTRWLVTHSVNAVPGRDRRFWSLEGTPTSPLVFILGTSSSGSSMLSHMLHELGVDMNPTHIRFWEDGDIALICEDLMPPPLPHLDHDKAKAAELIGGHIRKRLENAKTEFTGIKYPLLAATADAVLPAVTGSIYIIDIDRPLEDTIKSFIKRVTPAHISDKHRSTPESVRARQTALYAHKQDYFDRVRADHILHVQYYDVLDNPVRELRRIIDFLNLDVADGTLMRAASVADRGKCHYKSGA